MAAPPPPTSKESITRRQRVLIAVLAVVLPAVVVLPLGAFYVFGPSFSDRGAADRIVRRVRLGLPVTRSDITSNPRLGQPDPHPIDGWDASWMIMDDPSNYFGVTWLVVDFEPGNDRVRHAGIVMD